MQWENHFLVTIPSNTRLVVENVISHLPTPLSKILFLPVSCTEQQCTLSGCMYLSSWLQSDQCYCYYKLESSPFKANYMTNKQQPWCTACCLWEAWENNFPCFLSYHLLSEEVGLSVLMQYSRKAMFKELFPWAVQLFITHHSSLSTPGTAGTALVNEKSPCLTCRGWQPTPLGLSAEGGFVPRAGACQPCCVCPLPTPTLTGGQQPSPAASRNTQSCSPNGPELTSARHRTQGAREVAFLLHTSKGLLLGSKLLERKELLEVEGTGGKDSSFQLVSSSVSPDQ